MSTWQRQIDNAKTGAEVVAIIRDYLATWSPRELSHLPAEVRPGRIRDEEDVDTLHGKLVEEYRNTRASGDELSALQQLTNALVHASIRIAELRDGSARGGSSTPTTDPMKSGSENRS